MTCSKSTALPMLVLRLFVQVDVQAAPMMQPGTTGCTHLRLTLNAEFLMFGKLRLIVHASLCYCSSCSQNHVRSSHA